MATNNSEPVTKRLDKINENFKQGIALNKKLQAEFKASITYLNNYSVDLKSISELIASSTMYMIPLMEQLSALTEKTLKKEIESNTLKQKNVQYDIKGIEDRAVAMSTLIKTYDEEEKKIQKKYKVAKDANEKRALDLIIKAEGNKERISEIELQLDKQLRTIEEIRTNELKKHQEQRSKIVEEYINKTLDKHTGLYEKKKALLSEEAALQKRDSEIAYNAAIEQQKAIILQIEALDTESQKLEENIQKKEKAAKAIENIERMKAENIKAIDQDLKNKLSENTKAQLAETTAMVDKTITEFVSKSKDNEKYGFLKLIDYTKTKENLQKTQEELKNFKTILEKDKKEKELYFKDLEITYAKDPVKLKEAQEEKKKVMEQYKTDLDKIEKSITETSKKEKGLRLEQAKELTEKTMEQTKKALEQLNKDFEGVMSGVEDGFKIIGIEFDTTKYDDKINDNKKKLDEHTESAKKNIEELNWLKQKEAENSASLSQEEINRMAQLKKAVDGDFAEKQKLEKEKQNLEEKAKKAKDNRDRVEGAKGIIKASFEIARGVTKALGGGFIGIVQGAIIAAMGAVNLAKMTAQLAKFEDGGLLRGKRHREGGMRIEGSNIEVEGGEYVVNRESTGKNMGLIRYINSQRKELSPSDINAFFGKQGAGYEPPFRRQFEAGGELPAINNTVNVDNEALVDAIRSIKFAPRVAVTDIVRVQDQMAQVDGWTGM